MHYAGLLTSSFISLGTTHLAPPGGGGSGTPKPRSLLVTQNGSWRKVEPGHYSTWHKIAKRSLATSSGALSLQASEPNREFSL